jgi:1-acyl-sn-glycerol-3-phosphate acyltransferase
MNIVKSLTVWIIGLCYMVILFPITFIIWLVVLPFDRERLVTHWILMYQSLILVSLIPIWKIKIEGREKAVKGTTYVIISNHQSLLDILLINCLRFRFKWISKIENINLPFLGWYLRMAGYITIDRGNEESKAEMLEKSLGCLNRGISIMLFPEGTRSRTERSGCLREEHSSLRLRPKCRFCRY